MQSHKVIRGTHVNDDDNCVNVHVATMHLMHDATSRIDAKHPLTSARLAATQFAVRMMRRLAGAVGRLPHERL